MFGHGASGVWSSCREEIQTEPVANLNMGPSLSSSTDPFQTKRERWVSSQPLHSSSAPEQELLIVTAEVTVIRLATNLTWDKLL